MAAILKVWRRIENPIPSNDAHLLEHFCQVSSRSDLKRRSPRFSSSPWQQEEQQDG